MDSKFCECSITDKPQPCAMLEQKIMFCHFSLCAMLTVYQLNKLVNIITNIHQKIQLCAMLQSKRSGENEAVYVTI